MGMIVIAITWRLFTDANADLRHEFASTRTTTRFPHCRGLRKTYSELGRLSDDDIDYDLYLYNGNPDAGGVVVAQSTTRQRRHRVIISL
jgi:hypothetical protein